MKPAGNDLHRGTRGGGGDAGISAPARLANAPAALHAMPADLQAFMRKKTVSEVASALKTSRKTAHRLRHGYWPADARRILSAWQAYKGRIDGQSGWFLRRVHELGVIRHAGREWVCDGLTPYVGQTVAAAKTPSGLLAQTLEMPPKRLALEPVELIPAEWSH